MKQPSDRPTAKAPQSRATLEKALSILERVETRDAFAGRLLYNESKKAGSGMNLALLQQLVKGTLQWKGRIDALLSTHLEHGLASLNARTRNTLRLGAYQIMFLNSIPKEVAVNEAVELVKQRGSKGLAGLVNAVLRKIEREAADRGMEAQTADEIAEAFSHPLWLVERWLAQLGTEQTKALCAADNEVWPLQLRVNTLKTGAAELLLKLRAEGLEADPALYLNEIITVKKLPAGSKLHELESFKLGLFQVQDESSALIAKLLNAAPGELVFDLCSAPGGKTTHLAQDMRNQGRIVAWDLNERRLELVRDNCQRLGVSIVELKPGDARTLSADNLADKILLDAPCSGTGVLGRKADIRWSKSLTDITKMPTLQLELLNRAATLIKAGGKLLYSTCSIDREENEGVVQEFLRQHPHFSKASLPSPVPQNFITADGFFRSWPQRHHIGGAFGALLERVA